MEQTTQETQPHPEGVRWMIKTMLEVDSHNKDWLSDPALYEVTKRHLDQVIAKAGNDGQPTTPSGTQG